MTTLATDRLVEHILCPVDFSDYARTALRYADALARWSQARLTVLFVNDPLLGAAAAAAAYDVKKLAEKTDVELRRFVAGVLKENASTARVATAFGQPAPEIGKAVKRLGADLVVMGSRGMTGPGKWFFGSTTERVLRAAQVPVLVLPKSARRSRTLWSSPGRNVIVPVDLDDYTLRDVRAAVDFARAFEAKVFLLSVLPILRVPAWLRLDTRTHDRQRMDAARKRLEKLVKLVGGEAVREVIIGDPAVQIAARAADVRADLIVLMLKKSATAFGPRQGSITYRVLSSEVAPVLALPSSRRRS